MLSACKTKYVSVPEYHEVTKVRVDSIVKFDSIYQHDSIFTQLKGDTFYITKYKEKEVFKYLDRVHTDTLICTDSIRVPYPVEKKLSKWQQFKLDIGNFMIACV